MADINNFSDFDMNDDYDPLNNISRAITEANALYVLTRQKTENTADAKVLDIYHAIEDALSSLDIKEEYFSEKYEQIRVTDNRYMHELCETWELIAFVGFQCTLLLLKNRKDH